MSHLSLSLARPAPLELRLFETIFREQAGFVWRVLLMHGVPLRDAEDVMQDLFITVLRRIADYDPARPVKCWLFVFAVRFARMYRALARNRRVLLRRDEIERADQIEWAAELEPIDEAPGQERVVAARELCAVVLELLDRVTLPQRIVLILHDVEGIQMPEIVGQLGIGVQAGYSRLQRGRCRFSALYNAYLRDGALLPRRKKINGGAAMPAELALLDSELSQLLVSLRPAQALSPRAKRRIWGSLCLIAGTFGLKSGTAAASPRGTLASAPQPAVLALSIVACALVDSTPSPQHLLLHRLPREVLAAVEAPAEPPRPPPAGSSQASILGAAPAPTASAPGPAGMQSAPVPPISARPSSSSSPVSESERALLIDARHAMQRGNPYAALRILDTHERLFPQSPLGQEREIIRIEALIQAGTPAIAAERLQAFRKAHPDSILLPGFHTATSTKP